MAVSRTTSWGSRGIRKAGRADKEVTAATREPRVASNLQAGIPASLPKEAIAANKDIKVETGS